MSKRTFEKAFILDIQAADFLKIKLEYSEDGIPSMGGLEAAVKADSRTIA